MNIKHIIASVSMIAAASGAFAAQDATSPDSSLTREQVRAELIQARAAGELEINDGTFPFTPKEAPSNVTREEVTAETLRARAAGELEINDGTFPFMTEEAPSTLTREQVRAEVGRARNAGELDYNDATYPLMSNGRIYAAN
jgi:Domain of unknown function (DUF4148)